MGINVAGVSDEGDSAGTTRYLGEASGALHGSLTSAVTALQSTSWLIDTLGKEKGQASPPVAVEQYNKLLERSRLSSVGGLIVVKVRHKEQARELLAVVGCLCGPMAVMCPAFLHSHHSFVCRGEEEEDPHPVRAQRAGTSSSP